MSFLRVILNKPVLPPELPFLKKTNAQNAITTLCSRDQKKWKWNVPVLWCISEQATHTTKVNIVDFKLCQNKPTTSKFCSCKKTQKNAINEVMEWLLTHQFPSSIDLFPIYQKHLDTSNQRYDMLTETKIQKILGKKWFFW